MEEKYLKRNWIIFMLEGFFFSFAVTMNSQQTVMPAYIAQLSDNSFYISLLSIIFYGCTYFARIFSVIVGMNTKSPKKATIIMCGMHRLGFLFLFLSTFFASSNFMIAITVVLISFAVCCLLSGVSSPVFTMLVANTIPKGFGSFYGSYSLSGAIAGILASQLLTLCYKYFSFPLNYRIIFLICVVSAVIASVVLAFGIKETRYYQVKKRTKIKDLPKIFFGVWKSNSRYRQYIVVRMIVAAAEVSIPFFVVRVGAYHNIPIGYVGIISLVLLVAKMITSKIAGWLADKQGTMVMLFTSCIAGAVASILVLLVNEYYWIFPIFFLVSYAQNGVYLSENISSILYSNGRDTTVYAALSGVLITPVSVLVALLGGILANRFFYDMIFWIAVVLYIIAALFSILYKQSLEGQNE